MNAENYQQLCKWCDIALNAQTSKRERVAIPWLHIIREHPVFLKNYEHLFAGKPTLKRTLSKIWQTSKEKIIVLKTIMFSLFSSGVPWYGHLSISKVEVLFISHLLNESQIGKHHDFYFGDIPMEYHHNSGPVLIALLNHSGVSGKKNGQRWKSKSVSRVIFSRTLTFQKELKNLISLIKESISLTRIAKNVADKVYKRILTTASSKAISADALGSLRLYAQIKILVTTVRPRMIVVTHEGHAWERMAFAAARCVSPEIKCVGYQHAAIFKRQHAIRRILKEEYNPDHIFTSGVVSQKILEMTPGLSGITKSTLGSNRNLNNKEAINTQNIVEMANDICLVIPEGITSECNRLMEFSLECAEIMPEIKFIWRFHPSTSYAVLMKKNKKISHLPRNITLSKSSLSEDIKHSNIVLYRGSTAVVSAVVGNCRPIYLGSIDEMTIDPLFNLNNSWKRIVSSVDEFYEVLHFGDREKAEVISDRNNSIAYGKEYYTPYDYHELRNL